MITRIQTVNLNPRLRGLAQAPWACIRSSIELLSGKLTAHQRLCLAMALSLCLSPTVALAHHSFALFDQTKTLTIKGVVSRFEWTNPHVTIYVDVPGSPVQRFKIETGSVNALSRQGWKADAIKVGDKAEVSYHPLKTAEHPGGLLVEIKTAQATLKGGG